MCQHLQTIFFAHPKESAAPYFKFLTILKLDKVYVIILKIIKVMIWCQPEIWLGIFNYVYYYLVSYRTASHCLVHRMRNETDSIADNFLDVLTPASRIHDCNTRFVSKLNHFRPKVSTNIGKKSFKFSAPKILETIPLDLNGVCHIYHKFKKEWKSYLLINLIWS